MTQQTGYTCLFSEAFLKGHDRSDSLQESPLFKLGGNPIFSINEQQRQFIEQFFNVCWKSKIRNINTGMILFGITSTLIIHEALKMQPAETFVKHKDASTRIAIQFLDMLEKQFPIEHADHPLELKTAQGFADKLAVHVNHLNRTVKQVTGKSTTIHISERIITEAKALLQHTDWPVAQIAYALGYEYPSYFNNFFKKMTGSSPTSFRS